MNPDISLARQLLANGRIKEAISKIEIIIEEIQDNNFFKNRLILISSQFNISDKEKKLSLSDDETRINKSILNLLEILYDLEVELSIKPEVLDKENVKESAKENLRDLKLEPNIRDYRELRIIYESNEMFLEYFIGINKQIKRVIISDALDKNTIKEFTSSLETKLEELLILKELIMDLEKQIRRKDETFFINNDIFLENKHIYKDAENLIQFSKEKMSLLEIKYAIIEIKKTLAKLENPIRNINGQRLGAFVGIVFIIAFFYFYIRFLSSMSP